ncbi:hypothetical protein V1J52_16055 [Streptomyces sp. TRM 70351]|uniref:DUF7224 domain-containing protein n=1 Tax=Streptomyces sp. TRM 70351 TaxID=3116552 RepID=UPI002E7B0476|nr:hypothetical protein [Streptomyces sp. TRM 70351]MEE1929681.1 hypothetical protein [Streptomyces sp. TRM 70351]
MNFATLIKSGPTGRAALLLLPALVWYGAQNTESAIPSWESVTAQSTVVLGLITAVCGACAAWEGARLTSARVDDWATARGPLRIAVEHLAPVALLGLAGLLAALATSSFTGAAPPVGYPDPAILGAAFLAVLAHVAVGYLVGRMLNRLLGAAVMLVAGYLWGFWPAALASPAWLRHLNGQGVTECCTLGQEADPRSLAATALFGLALTAAASAALWLDERRLRTAVAGGLAVVGVGVSVTLAVPLGFDGTRPRDRSALECAGGAPQVCLWPEQQERRRLFRTAATEAGQRLEVVGVRLPARVEYSMVDPRDAEIRTATATSVLPGEPPACAQGPGAQYPGWEAAGVLYAWLALTAGMSAQELSAQWPPQEVSLARKVRALPAEAQAAWYERNMRSVRDCDVRPELSPASFRHLQDDAA